MWITANCSGSMVFDQNGHHGASIPKRHKMVAPPTVGPKGDGSGKPQGLPDRLIVELGTLSNSLTIEVVDGDMGNFSTETIIRAPREEVWEVLADIGAIHVWNPGVKDSHTTTDNASGVGASRHCDLGGRNYLEEVIVEYDEGERLTMRVTESNLPFAHADIRFLLQTEEASTRVIVHPEYELKFGLLGALMDRLFVRRSYEKGMQSLLRGLRRHVESEVQTA